MVQLGFQDCLDILSNPEGSYLSKWNVLWYWYQLLSFIPLVILTWIRFRNPLKNEDYYDNKKELPKQTILDVLGKIQASIYAFFYAPELVMNLFHLHSICKICYIIHHIFTIYGAYIIVKMNHISWFVFFPPAFHTLLLVFPTWGSLNYFYILSIINCYYGCMQKPYKGRWTYNQLSMYLVSLVLPLSGLWLFGCSNQISTS
jgi:hypothetical protein